MRLHETKKLYAFQSVIYSVYVRLLTHKSDGSVHVLQKLMRFVAPFKGSPEDAWMGSPDLPGHGAIQRLQRLLATIPLLICNHQNFIVIMRRWHHMVHLTFLYR